jgi:hypothetical protein
MNIFSVAKCKRLQQFVCDAQQLSVQAIENVWQLNVFCNMTFELGNKRAVMFFNVIRFVFVHFAVYCCRRRGKGQSGIIIFFDHSR